MKTVEEQTKFAALESDLNGFTGTENCTRWSVLFPRMVLTDGAKFLAEKAGAFWLMDAIASWQPKCLKDETLQGIQFWRLEVHADKSATLFCDRDTNDVAFKQEIPYTDFPLKEIKLYCAPSGDGKHYTILLPSEY